MPESLKKWLRKPSAPNSPTRVQSGRKSRGDKSSAIASTLKDLQEIKVETRKARRVVEMLESWLRDESGYDEKTWPKLKKSLERALECEDSAKHET